jgi:hypothetical protein
MSSIFINFARQLQPGQMTFRQVSSLSRNAVSVYHVNYRPNKREAGQQTNGGERTKLPDGQQSKAQMDGPRWTDPGTDSEKWTRRVAANSSTRTSRFGELDSLL